MSASGVSYTQTETFGQFPLSVVPGRDLHEALDASMTPGAGAQQWFTVLPPVLLLELSRFHVSPRTPGALTGLRGV